MLNVLYAFSQTAKPYNVVFPYFIKEENNGVILLTPICLIPKPIILSLHASFIVRYCASYVHEPPEI